MRRIRFGIFLLGLTSLNCTSISRLTDAEKTHLQEIVSSDRFYMGTALAKADKKESLVKIKFTSYAPSSGLLGGEFHWIEAGSIHSFSGALSNKGITIKEDGYIKQGNRMMGCEHTLVPGTEDILKGHYRCTRENGQLINFAPLIMP